MYLQVAAAAPRAGEAGYGLGHAARVLEDVDDGRELTLVSWGGSRGPWGDCGGLGADHAFGGPQQHRRHYDS